MACKNETWQFIYHLLSKKDDKILKKFHYNIHQMTIDTETPGLDMNTKELYKNIKTVTSSKVNKTIKKPRIPRRSPRSIDKQTGRRRNGPPTTQKRSTESQLQKEKEDSEVDTCG